MNEMKRVVDEALDLIELRETMNQAEVAGEATMQEPAFRLHTNSELILTALHRHPAGLTAADLTRETGISARNLYPYLADLEQDGEITSRTEGVAYPRQYVYSLTVPTADYPHAMTLNPGPNTSELPGNGMLRGTLYGILGSTMLFAAVGAFWWLCEWLRGVL